MPLTLRLVDINGNNLLKRRVLGDHVYSASFYYGPLLLGADAKHNQNLPDEILFVASKDYRIQDHSSDFALSNAHFRIPAAANNFLSTTTLVPISEQTGYVDWSDAWHNFERNGEKPIMRHPVRIVHNVRIKK